MEELQVVVFGVSDEVFGAETVQVGNITLYSNINKSEEMPLYIDGFLTTRNGNVPVVNLAKRLGLKETERSRKNKIIVTNIEGRQLGFTVDEVYEILKIPESDFERTPSIIQRVKNKYIKGVCKNGGKLISVLNLDEVLSDVELTQLQEKVSGTGEYE